MKSRIVKITPNVASEYLKHNSKNRKSDPKIVDRYASDMKRGEWIQTHQGIGFLTNGNLCDGQHRLMAIIKSGITLEMNVTRDIDERSITSIDQGKSRTIGDAIEISNLSDWIEPRDISLLKAIFNIKWAISPTMAVMMCDEIKPTLLFVKKNVSKRKKHITGSKVLSVIAIAHLNGADEERLGEFCRILVDGITVNEYDSAVIRLRDHLMDAHIVDFKKIHCALRAFIKFKGLKFLRSSDSKIYELPSYLIRFTKSMVE